MSRRKRHLLLQLLGCLVVVVLALGPCTVQAQEEYYTPKSLLIPLHDQKNQLHISVGRGGGYDLNLSYAFTNKFAVFATGAFDNGTKKRISIFGDRYNVERNDYVWRGGLGYFTETENAFLSILEYYIGAGMSKIDNYWYFTGDTDGYVTQANYWTTYAQVQTGKKFPKADYGFGLRIAYSYYNNFEFIDSQHSYQKRYYDNFWGLTAEPGFSFSYKILNDVKLNLQTGMAIPVISIERWELVKNTETNESFVSSGVSRIELFALLGRVSLQHNLNFSKKSD